MQHFLHEASQALQKLDPQPLWEILLGTVQAQLLHLHPACSPLDTVP